MSAFELESMTIEVGEWLRKKGLTEDVIDGFAGEFTATCNQILGLAYY